MGITQLGKHIGRGLENEITHLFILLGDNQLPEEAHTPGHIHSLKNGIDASGLGGDNFMNLFKKKPINTTTPPH